MKHPMIFGFIVVVIVAHFMSFWGALFLPVGFAIVMWATNKHDYTFAECFACVMFFAFTLMLGLWTLIISVPIIILMSRKG